MPYAALAVEQPSTVRITAQNQAAAPVAGNIPLGGTTIEADAVLRGWSAKKSILGKSVKNDANETLGNIEDVIVAPKDFVSFVVIGAGGFLGMAQRKVAIPMHNLQLRNNQWVLPGATKDALKQLPPFVYAR
jgi:hypothetical protein